MTGPAQLLCSALVIVSERGKTVGSVGLKLCQGNLSVSQEKLLNNLRKQREDMKVVWILH